MEKSIEHIWKEGFLKTDALVAPKINDLYNQKTIHIIDKFKRMFRINLIAIVVFAFVFLGVSFLIGIPLMGAIFFVSLSVLVVINKRLLDGLEQVDKGLSSYAYLKGFQDWIQKQVAVNKRISTVFYPITFLSIVIGFWFKDAEGVFLGRRLVNEVIIGFPDSYLILGIPVIMILVVLLVVVLLAFFGSRIYEWDLNLVYGRVFKKLEELLADIEALKAEVAE